MPKNISNNLSIYLDVLRVLAAFIVFISHTRNFLFPDLNLGALASGREAVAVFFVLSGFVISFVVSEKERGWSEYVAARLARIFPVAALAIFVTAIVDGVGVSIAPDHYRELNAQFDGFYKETSLSALISYLTFTNQFWFSYVVFGTDEPYWSLGFEIQYYIFFGLISYLPKLQKVAAALVWAMICGPKILLYLPLWLLGVLGYKIISLDLLSSKKIATGLFVMSVISLGLLKHFLGPMATLMYRSYSADQELINFCYFTAIGLLVLINIISFNVLADQKITCPPRTGKVVRWVAGGSFTLYLVHQPLVIMASAILDPVGAHRVLCIGVTVLILVVVGILAELGERRKQLFKALFRRILKARIVYS